MAGRAHDAQFCCASCRMSWNNRRMQRGAELYDLFMALRFERGRAQAFDLWRLVCAVASAYRDADRHFRAGRRSWRRIEDAVEAIPMAYSPQGDKR